MTSYKIHKKIFEDQQFPLAYVDLDLLDHNINSILKTSHRGTIRLASKSIRCVEILEYIMSKSNRFKGIMSFTAKESIMLAKGGFDDILLGYPCVDKNMLTEIANIVKTGKTITLMVDLVEHVKQINAIGKLLNVTIPICIDIDCSTNFGSILHFGVWRSSITSINKLQILLDEIKKSKFVNLEGLMGYEAQIAGVTDNVKGDFKTYIIRILKNISIKKVKKFRTQAINLVKNNGFELRFVNGGGTGSITETLNESQITEVTVGSGFYSPALFDYYRNFKLKPAIGFAIQVVRNPKQNYFTCLGGGYIASGQIDVLKQPLIHLPKGAKFDKNEGFGEVQTPIIYEGNEVLKIGDPIFLRHAKAGELCERFNELYLIRNQKIIRKMNTYRGDHFCFL